MGAAVAHIAQVCQSVSLYKCGLYSSAWHGEAYLHLAIFRYVDDYFGPERCRCSTVVVFCAFVAYTSSWVRAETVDHALWCFARLVKLLLGDDAIAQKKLDFGPQLCILGVDIQMSQKGFQCRPSVDKAERCVLGHSPKGFECFSLLSGGCRCCKKR